MRKTIQLPIDMPEEGKERESCEECLRGQLTAVRGVESARWIDSDNPKRGQLELVYDPRLIGLAALEQEVKRSGGCLCMSRAQMVLGVKGMVSPRTEQIIERTLGKLPGVVASASFAGQTVRVEFDRRECAVPEIVRRLEQLGVTLVAAGAGRRSGRRWKPTRQRGWLRS